MRCAICGDQIDTFHSLVLPTTDGQHVHLICAERQARAAARRRTIQALAITVLLSGLFLVDVLLGLLPYGIVILGLLFVSLHVGINRRWWLYTAQSVRLWWRLRR